MEVRELFKKAKHICDHFSDSCTICPLTGWCTKRIFAITPADVEGLEFVVDHERSHSS